MFDITFAEAQVALLAVGLFALVIGRMQQGLFRLLSEPHASSQRLFYQGRTAPKRR